MQFFILALIIQALGTLASVFFFCTINEKELTVEEEEEENHNFEESQLSQTNDSSSDTSHS